MHHDIGDHECFGRNNLEEFQKMVKCPMEGNDYTPSSGSGKQDYERAPSTP